MHEDDEFICLTCIPSSDARIDCGANAKAAKFKSDPVTKMAVPTTNTGESQALISSASSSGELTWDTMLLCTDSLGDSGACRLTDVVEVYNSY